MQIQRPFEELGSVPRPSGRRFGSFNGWSCLSIVAGLQIDPEAGRDSGCSFEIGGQSWSDHFVGSEEVLSKLEGLSNQVREVAGSPVTLDEFFEQDGSRMHSGKYIRIHDRFPVGNGVCDIRVTMTPLSMIILNSNQVEDIFGFAKFDFDNEAELPI